MLRHHVTYIGLLARVVGQAGRICAFAIRAIRKFQITLCHSLISEVKHESEEALSLLSASADDTFASGQHRIRGVSIAWRT